MNNLPQKPHSCQTAVSGSAFSIHDLKCGNILNYDTAEGKILPTVIDWQDLKWLTEDPKGFNLVHSPVVLTKEILSKLLFFGSENTSTLYRRPLELWYSNYAECYQVRYYHVGSDIEKTINFHYVHELQNYYYEATGEMLSLSFPITHH